MNVDNHDMELKNGTPHFTKKRRNNTMDINKNETLLVVRGHKTSDIQGVSQVIDNATFDCSIGLTNRFFPVHVLIESSPVSKEEAKEHCKDKRKVIYVGGTALMWYRLRNVLTFKLNTKLHYAEFKLKKPFTHKIKVNIDQNKDALMVYENRDLDGVHVVALFGLSPGTTRFAVKHYIKSCEDNYHPDKRMIVGEYRYGDVIVAGTKTLFMFDRSAQ